jgi:formyl-CoA transferase
MLRMMKPTLSWSEGPLTIRSLPPSLGQHSAEILREAGYSNEDITEMVKNQVTRTPEK